MEADFSGLVPADPQSASFLPESVRMQMNVLIGGQKRDTGEKIAVELWMEMTLDKSETPIKEAPRSKASLHVARASLGACVLGTHRSGARHIGLAPDLVPRCALAPAAQGSSARLLRGDSSRCELMSEIG